MSFAVRDGRFDVVVVAGPRLGPWPSAGVRALSATCAEMGLTVGLIGGDSLVARGVIPLPGTGGLVLAEDLQKRIHRIHARALVRVSLAPMLPDPFPGWRSPGLIPLPTALRLQKESRVLWDPATVILGTGNAALRFGSSLLEAGAKGVICVESHAQWGAKRFSGWEVERRRFESGGGRLLEAKPVRLSAKSPLIWELRVEDAQGIRLIETARVVSAGPFRDTPGVREYPPGSFLYELDQTASATRHENVEGWLLEEERGRWLAGKIVKALVSELGSRRDDLDRIYKRARARLKRAARHREEPFTPAYQGKWIAPAESKAIRAFEGVPREAHKLRPTASIECFEDITCNLCEKSCPESAIEFSRARDQILIEADCTACGLCLSACPSGSTLLIHEQEERSTSRLTLPWRGRRRWEVGEFATLVNRRGENLGSGRVTALPASESAEVQLVQVDVPTHLAWEARGLRRGRVNAAVDEAYLASLAEPEDEKVEITLDGEKRLVRDRIPVSSALFEIGQSRPADVLACPDGSCGMCSLLVDGVKKLACRVQVHRGMAIRLEGAPPESPEDGLLCPCLGVTREQVVERMRQGKLQSPEAVLSVTHVGEGKCHGQLCQGAFRRVLAEEGLDVSQWIDWRFPWSEWVLTPGAG